MEKERRGIEAARKAVDAFREHMGYEPDDLDPESILSDLITDLMYLADRQDISGLWLIERAETNYREEADDEPIGDEIDDEDDFGQTEPDPEIGGAEKPTDLLPD